MKSRNKSAVLSVIVGLALSASACSKKDEKADKPKAEPTPAADTPATKTPAAKTQDPTMPDEPGKTDDPDRVTPVAAPLPTEAAIEQSKVYWAVYFAYGPVESDAFKKAQKLTTEIGMKLHHKDANCDVPVEGKPAPPSMKGEGMLLSAYYDAENDAKHVAKRYGAPTLWVGQVTTMCLD